MIIFLHNKKHHNKFKLYSSHFPEIFEFLVGILDALLPAKAASRLINIITSQDCLIPEKKYMNSVLKLIHQKL